MMYEKALKQEGGGGKEECHSHILPGALLIEIIKSSVGLKVIITTICRALIVLSAF